jgi:hypothetical protein
MAELKEPALKQPLRKRSGVRPFVRVLKKVLKQPQKWKLVFKQENEVATTTVNNVGVMVWAYSEHMGTDPCTDEEVYQEWVKVSLNGQGINLQVREMAKLYVAVMSTVHTLKKQFSRELKEQKKKAIADVEAAELDAVEDSHAVG